MTAAPVVGLWAHRWDDLHKRTGVGRYALELAAALAAGEHAGRLRYERRGGAPADQRPDLPPLATSRLPRPLLHAAWQVAPWPRIEWTAPGVDLLHVLFPSFPVRTRRPLVGTIHDLFVLHEPGWYPRSEARAVAASTRRLADEAAAIVCVSAHVAAQVEAELGVETARLAVVHHGVRPPPPPPAGAAPARARPYVVALGSVVPRKNLEVLVRALEQVDSVDLLLIGPTSAASAPTLAAIERSTHRGRVEVVGPLADDEVARLLAGAVALVHPSLDEGFGIPPIEAMALGVPAIVSSSGSLPEVTAGAATVVDAGDPAAWAAAIHSVLLDERVRADLVERGRSRAAELTWERAAAATAAVHRSVLGGSSS